MKITLQCDDCGVVGSHVSEARDGGDYCRRCYLIREIEYARQAYEAKKEWVESVWIRNLREREENIKSLEAELGKLA